ncbi:NADH-quinone oxidoreductase subunit N [Ekhidna sp.]|uniref:NADH-quinone oxidoreductase subunit N n=1 Tax=Ekhidna sp. TaxID=2608089 RepID=UPI003B5CBD4C
MSLNDQLNGILNDLQGVWTETSLIVGAILLLITGLINSNRWLIKGCFLIVLLFALFLNQSNDVSGLLLEDGLRLTSDAFIFGTLFVFVGILLLIFQRQSEHLVEFYFFILALLAGSLFMMKANSLLIVYLSIELASFSSYILTNFSFRKKGFEAGIKYLLFGAISSAIMLFGIGLIYGSTGAFFLSEWNVTTYGDLLPQVGFVLMLIGIFFKISIVPSHIWVPATYETAPADATAFMSIVPKLAGLVLLKNIFALKAFTPGHWVYSLILVLGIATIIVGTLGALRQHNARRMISFGAIAHSGFLLPFAILDISSDAFWYYAVTYALMNVAVFYLLDEYEKQGVNTTADYVNAKASVWVGVTLTLILISLVGIPPLAGFTAKFFLFANLWESFLDLSNNLIMWYLIVAVLATVGSLFFYLQIPKQLFLGESTDDQSINFKFSTKILATLFCIALLLLFFAPQLVMEAKQLLNNVHE